ncbi:hypothetical protein [Desulfocurvibacter africanus]|uniref:ArsR family transcriptional regulator n=1 Tax=Desulfocurvibacter africanus subsp. africanus str. Walvis Bay TaxID=690850 RepID=F3YW06_DESAF|nr:hypothetical protein [Desulfocurvibacter africanus]EGJ49036.1 hypothetical protein Desaf_0684 [Desulfocurvibacter africanus subsp. africanus str. Walvis Bay]
MSTFAQLVTEDRRLVILRVLSEDPGYATNTSLLHAALGTLGHNCTRDQVATDANWLQEQALVTVEPSGPVTLVRLTGRGEDVAAGRATVPGVRRPSPR